MNAIEFRNVSKKFRKGEKFDSLRDAVPGFVKGLFSIKDNNANLKDQEFWAVKDVSFELKRGEALGIIGPNGAGKSTILKLLSQILKPTKGDVVINGRLSALIEVGAGFHPDLTGRENIYLSGAIIGMRKREIDSKLDSIIAFSELEDFIDTPVKRYSSGMNVRLGFSVAIHLDPDILLIDEILSVGDFRFQRKSAQKIQEFIRNGIPIIFISHNLPEVMNLCPKAILLNKGEVVKVGESKKVVHDYYKAWGDSNKVEEEIKIKKAELLSSDSKPAVTLRAGEIYTLRLEFIPDADLSNVAVAFAVKREDGLAIFDSHSDITNSQTFDFRAHTPRVIDISFRVALPEGLYYASVYLQKDAGKIYFYNDELLQFHVVGPRLSAQSYTFLEPKWRGVE